MNASRTTLLRRSVVTAVAVAAVLVPFAPAASTALFAGQCGSCWSGLEPDATTVVVAAGSNVVDNGVIDNG